MADVVDKRDVTKDLPDEVLCHVFSFLTLSEKLQLEAVNHKFQRCVIKELAAKPQPFVLLGLLDPRMLKLNGFDVSVGHIFGAVQTLAKKTKFSSISVSNGSESEGEQDRMRRKMDQILSLLIKENLCLSKVTSFESNVGCSQAVLENFLDKCDKLCKIKLDFNVHSTNSPLVKLDLNSPQSFPFLHSFPLDLCRLLKNRGLSELKLCPLCYPNKDLPRVFQVIRPDTLRKLDLSFETRGLNLVELLKALSPNGSVLEEIRFQFHKLDVDLSGLFESLAQLPALRKCDIDCILLLGTQFVSAVTSLFTLSHINITVNADRVLSFVHSPACEFVNMVRQIQNEHPGLVVDFDVDDEGTLILILSLGNATIRKSIIHTPHCAAADCVECQSFYPCLLQFLRSRLGSHSEDPHHFPNWQLDRCRVGQIVDQFNANTRYCYYPFEELRALSVESSDDQQSVAINFESAENLDEVLSITIGCGQCITNGCIKCLDWVLLL